MQKESTYQMISNGLISDQSFLWSARYEREIFFRSEETPQLPAAQAATTGLHPPGFSHRAVQALWKTRMQVRRRSRARPQVLPFGQLPWQVTANGLRSPKRLRRGQRAHRQLSAGTRNSRRDIRDQPRIAAPKRGALRSRGEPGTHCAYCPHRHSGWRSSYCQHARRLDRTGTHACLNRGDCR